jgi:hypothetical protein
MALTTEVWTGRGFNPKRGILSLDAKRLRFELDDQVIFDAPAAELRITWPWYGFGCQFWAHAPAGDWFISFLHTNNTLYSWWTGVRKGRTWKRAIENALA